MEKINKLIIPCIMVFLILGNVFAQEKVHKTFKAKKEVRIRTVSGDCIVEKGDSDMIIVDLTYFVRPMDAFEPEFEEKGNVLKLSERWYGSSSGEVTWKITVPEKTEIDFSTASGNLTIRDMNNSVKANTASGEITVENSEGEFDFNTASGDIVLENTKGEFDLSTASGEIEANNIQGEFEMSTASGDIDVKNSKGILMHQT